MRRRKSSWKIGYSSLMYVCGVLPSMMLSISFFFSRKKKSHRAYENEGNLKRSQLFSKNQSNQKSPVFHFSLNFISCFLSQCNIYKNKGCRRDYRSWFVLKYKGMKSGQSLIIRRYMSQFVDNICAWADKGHSYQNCRIHSDKYWIAVHESEEIIIHS